MNLIMSMTKMKMPQTTLIVKTAMQKTPSGELFEAIKSGPVLATPDATSEKHLANEL